MNKIYSSLSLILLLLTLGSCDSMFDNEIPPHDLVGDNAITNESSAKVALNGVYSYLEGWGTWSAYYICDNEFRTGLLDPTAFYRSKTEGEQLPRLQVLDDNSDAENPWKSGYKIVNSANNFIYYTDRLPEDGNVGRSPFPEGLRACFFVTEIRIFLGSRQPVRDDYTPGTFFAFQQQSGKSYSQRIL